MKAVAVTSCQAVAQGREKELQGQSWIKHDKLLLHLSKPREDGQCGGVDPRHG